MTTTTAPLTIPYARICTDCGTRLAAGAGHLGGKVNGRRTVRHAGCTATPAPVTTSRDRFAACA